MSFQELDSNLSANTSGSLEVGKLWKDMLARKCQVRRIVDFGPRKSCRAGKAHMHSAIRQLLHGNIEELVDSALVNESVQRSTFWRTLCTNLRTNDLDTNLTDAPQLRNIRCACQAKGE